MNVLDLFSGIGGFSLGLERAGMRTVAFCEIEPYCRAVLARHWPHVLCFSDVRMLDRGLLDLVGVERIDLICGGFPCQPHSSAARGRNRGEQDPRHLWPEMFRLVCELRPTWVICENVPGFARRALSATARDFTEAGYSFWCGDIPAAAVGAEHERPRLWMVAHADREGEPRLTFNAEMASLPALPGALWTYNARTMGNDDGVPGRMDRLRCLGNAVVPQIVEFIGHAIMRLVNDGR